MFEVDKRRFVDEACKGQEKSRARVLKTLLLLSDKEREWNMDFTMQEDLGKLQSAFYAAASSSRDSLDYAYNKFRLYASWRADNHLPCADSVFNLERDYSCIVRDTMVRSPAHLLATMDAAFDDPTDMTSDIAYRAYLWLGYFGISAQDALSVTRYEIDFLNMRIDHNGKLYEIYPESRRDLRAASVVREFAKYTVSRSMDGLQEIRYFRRADGDEIARVPSRSASEDSCAVRMNTMWNGISKKIGLYEAIAKNDDFPRKLTFSRAFESGRFYRLYLRELEYGDIDFESIAIREYRDRERSDRPYKEEWRGQKQQTILRLRHRVQDEYNDWKKAFGL